MKYTENQITWLKENYSIFNSYEVLTESFNLIFCANRSVRGIQQFLTKRLHLYLQTEKNSAHYTKEQEIWLAENYNTYSSYDELTDEFNRTFNRNKSRDSIREKCSRNLKLKGMENRGVFKKGNIKEQCPIGTIREGCSGVTYIKVKDSKYSYISGYQEPYWLPIQKKVWQDHYGKVPEGKMVIFLDGNHENLDINNLYCIDRKIAAIMAKNHWYTNSIEHTLTAIKWCELYYAMKNNNSRNLQTIL